MQALFHRAVRELIPEKQLAMCMKSPMNVIFFDPVIHFQESVLGKSPVMWIKIYISEFSIYCYL